MLSNNKIKGFIFMILFITLVGCNKADGGSDGKNALIQTMNSPPIAAEKNRNEENLVQEINETVLSIHKIYDVVVVKGKEEVLVAYKVKHLHRFRMKQIEKELKDKLEKTFKDEKFSVSSDYKIFLEAVRLQQKAEKEKWDTDKIDQRLKEIIKLSEEKT